MVIEQLAARSAVSKPATRLSSLGPEQAKLIQLAHLKGLKAEQIATMLGKPSAQAVRASLCWAMKDLRAALQRQGYFDRVPA